MIDAAEPSKTPALVGAGEGRRSAPDRAVAAWLFAVAAMVFVMALIGAITRLTQSGLSMVEWRPVMGALPPLNEADWQALFRDYQASPEFRPLHAWMALEDFQAVFWWGYAPRLWGRLVGFPLRLPLLFLPPEGRLAT